MELTAKGLRIVVTAGACGIGRAIAETLDEAGARVVVCDVDPDACRRLEAERPGIRAAVADVSDEAAVASFFEQALGALGGIDCLINNAGISGPTAAIDTISFQDWQRVLDVNLSGLFLCTRAAVPALKASPDASIINMSSVSGRLGVPLRTPYAATKWGVVGMTQSLAKELGPAGIRVNAILPGFIEGPRMERVIASRAARTGQSLEAMTEKYLEKVSLRRMVSAHDVAMQVLYLVSPLGRAVSGQSIGVCGNVEFL